MKPLLYTLVSSIALLLPIKLFTYEFYLPDDPTCGIALRAEPMLDSRLPLRGAAGMHRDIVLMQDENDFIGAGLYRFTVRAGWMLLPSLTALATGALLLRRPREGC